MEPGFYRVQLKEKDGGSESTGIVPLGQDGRFDPDQPPPFLFKALWDSDEHLGEFLDEIERGGKKVIRLQWPAADEDESVTDFMTVPVGVGKLVKLRSGTRATCRTTSSSSASRSYRRSDGTRHGEPARTRRRSNSTASSLPSWRLRGRPRLGTRSSSSARGTRSCADSSHRSLASRRRDRARARRAPLCHPRAPRTCSRWLTSTSAAAADVRMPRLLRS